MRPTSDLDRAADRLQVLLLSILEHALDAYGPVQPLDEGDPLSIALRNAGEAFDLGDTPVFRSAQGDDALGLVLGPERKPAWVVGSTFDMNQGTLSPSKRFIVGQLASAYALGVLPFVIRDHANAVSVWKSIRMAAGQMPLKAADHRFEETLRARIPKQLQRELGPLLRRTTNREIRTWCERAYETVLRVGATYCGELDTPVRALTRQGGSKTAQDGLMRFWLSEDAEAAIRLFWTAP